ncbi:cyclic nucleotide-binding domain-containing protein [Tahibacter amnicola]|uniref:Cyclic nucleotide-binding domain-containing protein n=1 Tax=Tahibacter amnicola TaxID=2976241 RepID=A0ABY6BJF3_9GAMM|nr:cyclic nucleotide-binding domain-containing protein [Tahibacter amnicola]UXI68741.1 cyclic nucleotide-binding domain-containing protein [Tahibacter amnicola]
MAKANDLYIEVPAGQWVFREGEPGAEMFIIESGTVEIRRSARGDVTIATLESGDFFGDMAMLEDQPRFASALARTDCRLLRIQRAAFADLLRQNVEIAVRIMRKLAARHRRAEQRAAELQAALDQLRGAAATAAKPATEPAVRPPRPVTPLPPPSAVGPAVLVHAASGQRFALDPARTEFLIGRTDPVTGITPEINLGPLDASRSLSRRHAKLLSEGGIYFLREEVGTANGTFVNGQRLATGATVPLKTGDRLKFGAVEIELVAA